VNLLDDLIAELHATRAALSEGHASRAAEGALPSWPRGGAGAVVLRRDTAVELGGPRTAAVASLLWTGSPSLVTDGRVTLSGPDLSAAGAGVLPFGRVTLLRVRGFTEETCCARHRDLELARFDLELDGYMLRAASHRGCEWGRVSHAAAASGRSLFDLGAALIAHYRGMPAVSAAEILFVTATATAVRALAPIAERATRRLAAVDKRTSEPVEECDTCEYSEVCSEVEALRQRRSAHDGGPHA